MNYRTMLEKYVRIVGNAEGVHFLHPSEWSEEEWSVWQEIITEENNWVPLKDYNE
jgi:hypothetical protein